MGEVAGHRPKIDHFGGPDPHLKGSGDMPPPGPKPRPYLAAVREGRTSHRTVQPGLVLPPSDPIEPDWDDLLPGDSADAERVRRSVATTWARTAVMLTRSAGLTNVQRDVLVEYCIAVARIEQSEWHLSIEGPVVNTERGNVKSPWVTVLNQYRSHFRALVGELGLSPASSRRVVAVAYDDEEDPFD